MRRVLAHRFVDAPGSGRDVESKSGRRKQSVVGVSAQTQKLAMVKLAWHADDGDGDRAFPGRKSIAAAAQCSERHIPRVLGVLVNDGYIERVADARQHRPAQWRVIAARLDAPPPQRGRQTTPLEPNSGRTSDDTAESASGVTSGVTSATPGVTSGRAPRGDVQTSPERQRTSDWNEKNARARASAGDGLDQSMHERVLELRDAWSARSGRKLLDDDVLRRIDELRCEPDMTDRDVEYALTEARARIDDGPSVRNLPRFVVTLAHEHRGQRLADDDPDAPF